LNYTEVFLHLAHQKLVCPEICETFRNREGKFLATRLVSGHLLFFLEDLRRVSTPLYKTRTNEKISRRDFKDALC